ECTLASKSFFVTSPCPFPGRSGDDCCGEKSKRLVVSGGPARRLGADAVSAGDRERVVIGDRQSQFQFAFRRNSVVAGGRSGAGNDGVGRHGIYPATAALDGRNERDLHDGLFAPDQFVGASAAGPAQSSPAHVRTAQLAGGPG